MSFYLQSGSAAADYLEALTYMPSIELYQVPYIAHAIKSATGSTILDTYIIGPKRASYNIVSLMISLQSLEVSRS
jgi:hypothetical protein